MAETAYSFMFRDKGKRVKCGCGKTFVKNSANHKYCKKCKKQKAREQNRGR